MQETEYTDDTGAKKRWMEFFEGVTERDVIKKMDTRFDELQPLGHSLIKREQISMNQLCPCGSGKKFKRCCISKITKLRDAAGVSQEKED